MDSKDYKLKLDAATERVEKSEALLIKYQNRLEIVQAKIEKLKEQGINLDDNGYTAANWSTIKGEDYDTYYKRTELLSCIKSTEKNIKDQKAVRDGWATKYKIAVAKETELANIPAVVKEFVHAWRLKAFDWVMKKYDKYVEESKRIFAIYNEAEKKPYDSPERKEMMADYSLQYKRLRQSTEAIVSDLVGRSQADRISHLNSILDKEEQNKIFDLINRVTKVTGRITDASLLTIGDQQGELNGIVVGENGKARVNTVGAGGYNIQCFHYRVLVREVK